MRSFRHWTPRYILSRIIERRYRRLNPGLPWLTQTANAILPDYLLPTDVGLELGSGRSTLWFAQRVASLTSIEHNPEWYARVRGWLEEEHVTNVDYQLHPAEDGAGSETPPAYVRAVENIPIASLDFALVDGIYRDLAALAVLPRLKPGGVLIIDNANLYLPCGSHAPNSRHAADGPAGPQWADFLEHIAGWRRFWTGNGVSDTAFFFRPPSSG